MADTTYTTAPGGTNSFDSYGQGAVERLAGAEQVLENTYLVDEHGNKRKLPKKKS